MSASPGPSKAAQTRPPHIPLTAYYESPRDRSDYVMDIFNKSAAHYDTIEKLYLNGGLFYRRMSLKFAGITKGMKVLDVASFIAGPVATTIMADFGADVIKIEAPGGDPYRTFDRGPGMPQLDFDYAWLADNRSKRGV